ncbi:hypothetical protein [Capnocytophaga catalasegens]|uniref:Uncharacterized protein n=1 Tax=Capnocytophaga catalasegens TaxID=1004260 RepID=A0AAV5ATG8_9FLAO|nr:hypothetical protein [Capnocytophaga catalasegens]GIZ15521.1 hypothetical protein RCZ03_15210 [Capnocytophaga catalasegens]GJM49864.1 hypothetical protein RCZ15_08390 [Capnocytophaga catalasegens]GJM54036.1 hypothetical protein RCZ16_23520 [Capnocytophaga catalasegens]
MTRIEITPHKNGYSPEQCGKTLSVAELIEILQQYDKESLVYFNNDNGYTFGSINESDIEEVENEKR